MASELRHQLNMVIKAESETADQVARSDEGTRDALHGGRSFAAIGEDFSELETAGHVVNADVLDAWFDPSPYVLRKLERNLPFVTRTSPPIYAAGLVRAIAHARKIPEDCILAAGGSSDLIFTCLPRLVGSYQKVMLLDPMYGEYRHVLSDLIGADVSSFDLRKEDAFQIDTDALIRRVLDAQPHLVVLVNPNSPTGQHWPREEVVRFLNSIPESVKVIIDETYIDYVDTLESVETEAAARYNLVVIKSMSKVYALSGMRVAYLVGPPATIRCLAKFIRPWAVGLAGQAAAVEALKDTSYYQNQYEATHLLREELMGDLRNVALRVYPSSINLVLVETRTSAEQIVERMSRWDIFVRNCDSMGARFADRFLRIAVKGRHDNDRIVRALRGAIGW
jgi:histidinol-phosphate/aromatic aminotransferase/cobyric acid decarboxylase-like protein